MTHDATDDLTKYKHYYHCACACVCLCVWCVCVCVCVCLLCTCSVCEETTSGRSVSNVPSKISFLLGGVYPQASRKVYFHSCVPESPDYCTP